jgi:hypothetical protein
VNRELVRPRIEQNDTAGNGMGDPKRRPSARSRQLAPTRRAANHRDRRLAYFLDSRELIIYPPPWRIRSPLPCAKLMQRVGPPARGRQSINQSRRP